MGEQSKIEWCDHTFNAWIGCQKVSAACDNCYAHDNTFVRIQRKAGRELWGNTLRSERHITADANWRKPIAWNAAAEKAGERHRVFCASLADVFEAREELAEPRARLFALIEATPHLDWLLLTKRPENVMDMVPDSWRSAFPGNVWLGTSTGTQEEADERIPHLLRCPATVRFLSCEPLLGPVRILGHLMGGYNPGACLNCGYGHGFTRCPNYGAVAPTWAPSEHAPPVCSDFRRRDFAIHWVIAGGESGPGARPCDVAWLRSLRDQCRAAGVPYFLKQLGANVPYPEYGGWDIGTAIVMDPEDAFSQERVVLLRDRKGGDPAEWPEGLRIREFPHE